MDENKTPGGQDRRAEQVRPAWRSPALWIIVLFVAAVLYGLLSGDFSEEGEECGTSQTVCAP